MQSLQRHVEIVPPTFLEDSIFPPRVSLDGQFLFFLYDMHVNADLQNNDTGVLILTPPLRFFFIIILSFGAQKKGWGGFIVAQNLAWVLLGWFNINTPIHILCTISFMTLFHSSKTVFGYIRRSVLEEGLEQIESYLAFAAFPILIPTVTLQFHISICL